MIFGDKHFFAIEIKLNEDYGGAWLFGKFCYWIKGVQVGDYELGTSLRDVLFQMKWIVHDCGNRNGEVLCRVSLQEAFSRLERFFSESGEPNAVNRFQVPHTPARFDIQIFVDIFYEWRIYLIECSDKANILFKKIKDESVNIATIPIGEFDRAIKDAYDCLNELYDKEIANCE
jgi:hypothetical protein